MTLRKRHANGIEALNLATDLMQRARMARPYVGVFEAADIQWAWRTPRLSDDSLKTFWIDDNGPVAGILLTSYSNETWQIDPVIVPDAFGISASTVWMHMLFHIDQHRQINFQVPISNDDPLFSELAEDAGFTSGDQDSTGWLDAANQPGILEVRDGYQLADRTERPSPPHPMSDRNGEHVEKRLQDCTLYDPSLDLSIESVNGELAGYSLYWFDPVTKVGLIEPVRVLEEFQRKGLARAMLTHGIDRLIAKGADRIKVSWETEAAGTLYLDVGFKQQSTTTWYLAPKNR